MKSAAWFIKSLLVIVLLLSSLLARADHVEIAGIYYFFDRTTKLAQVQPLPNSKYSGKVIVPGYITVDGEEYRVNSIGENAFRDCTNLTSVELPNTFSMIYSHAFRNSGITAITIPEGVRCIENAAFHSCKYLSSADLPKSLTEIKPYAFTKTGLKSIVIPEGVKTLGAGAFGSCEQLESVRLLGYVESWGGSVFADCTALSSVSFADSLTSISAYMFSRCTQLSSIILPSSLKTIGDMAFSQCSFTELVIPEGVTDIGEMAFERCKELKSLSIPSSVTKCGSGICFGCSQLEFASISCSTYSSGAFSSCDSLLTVKINCMDIDNTFSKWFEKFTLAGSASNFPHLILGPDVKTIDATAFSNVDLLDVSVEGENIPEIKGYFANVTLKLNEKHIHSLLSPAPFSYVIVDYNEKEYFPIVNVTGSENVEVRKAPNIKIPNINGFVFLCDKSTEKININVSGGHVFFRGLSHYSGNFSYDCDVNKNHYLNAIYYYPESQIQTIQLPSAGSLLDIIGIEKVKTIKWLKISGPINGTDLLVLKRMENLEYLNLQDANVVDGGMAYYENNTTKNDCIGTHFLDGNIHLQTVVLPESAKIIEDKAFTGCPFANFWANNIQSIGNNAFEGCYNMHIAVIPGSVTSIATGAYNGCVIKKLYLSDGANYIQGEQNIPGSAIEYLYLGRNLKTGICRNNKALQEVDFSSQVSEIANDMFNGCSALSNIAWPSELQKVGSNAFAGCTVLPSVKLGSKVQSVGAGAFAGCSDIKVVCSLNSTPPDIQSTTFDAETEKSATLYVPIGSKPIYWLHQYWGNFYNIVETDNFEAALGIESHISGGPSIQMRKVYNLSGQLVKTFPNSQSLERQLPTGIYIIDGKKVIVR